MRGTTYSGITGLGPAVLGQVIMSWGKSDPRIMCLGCGGGGGGGGHSMTVHMEYGVNVSV